MSDVNNQRRVSLVSLRRHSSHHQGEEGGDETEAMLNPYLTPKTREVHLVKRKGAKSLGFTIRGGKEHGVGIFISEVEVGSEAHMQGLKVGDQLLRVNGFSIEQAIHREVVNLFRGKNKLVLRLRSVGLIPVKDRKNDPLTWKVVESAAAADSSSSSSPILKLSPRNSTAGSEVIQVKLFVDMTGHSNLGCSICKGPPDKPGIFVQSTKDGGLAREVGLRAGDQIIGVNGVDFLGAEFQDAVKYIKCHQRLEFYIRKGVACDLFPGESSGYNSSSSSFNGEINGDETKGKLLPTLEEEGDKHPFLSMNGHHEKQQPHHDVGVAAKMAELKLQNVEPEPTTSRTRDMELPDGESSLSSHSVDSQVSNAEPGPSSSSGRRRSSPQDTDDKRSIEQISLEDRMEAEAVVQEIVRAAEEELQKRVWADRLQREKEAATAVETRKAATGGNDKSEVGEETTEKPSLRVNDSIWRRTVIAEVHNNPLPAPPTSPKVEEEDDDNNDEPPPPEPVRKPPPVILPEEPKDIIPPPPVMMEVPVNTSQNSSPKISKSTGPPSKMAEELQKKMNHDQLIEEFKRVHQMMFNAPNGGGSDTSNHNDATEKSKFTRQNGAVNGTSEAYAAVDSTTLKPPQQFADPVQRRESDDVDGRLNNRQITPITTVPSTPFATNQVSLDRLRPPDVNKSPSPQLWDRDSNSPVSAMRSPSPSSPTHITDSRVEVPKPPNFFFPKESKGTRRGPLVTIGTYQGSTARPAPSRFGFLQQTSSAAPHNEAAGHNGHHTKAGSSVISVTTNGHHKTSTYIQANGNAQQKQASAEKLPSHLANNKVTIQVPATEPPRTIVKVETPPTRVATATSAASREPASILKQAGKGPSGPRKKSLSFEDCPIIIEELSKPEVVVQNFNPLNLFTKKQIAGREVRMFSIPKANPLDVHIEGGLGSPLAGRVIVADILEGGEIYKHGVISKGDQLMWVNGHSLLDITLSQAQGVLRDAAKNLKEPLKVIVAKAPPGLYDDVTFF